MKKLILLVAITQTLGLSAQQIAEQEITTKVIEATVFFENAQISRHKKLQVKSGTTTLKFVDLSPFIKPNSIQAKVSGKVTVLQVNHQLNYLDELSGLNHLEQQLKEIENKIQIEEAYISVIDEEIMFLQANRNIGGKNQELSVSNLKEASQYYGARLTTLKLEKIERQQTLTELREQFVAIRNQLHNNQASGKMDPTGEILILVHAESATNMEIDLSYVVENAGWFPGYDIRANNIRNPLEIAYKAHVHQNTGVDWSDVKLTLSSGNPGLSGSAPVLKTYFLNYGSVPPGYDITVNEARGTILDSQGTPMPGANIVVKGTTIGTVADMNGRFSLALPPEASTLVISYVGYLTQEIPATKSELRIIMVEDQVSLDEVVVTAYGVSESDMEPLPGRTGGANMTRKKAEKSSLTLPMVQMENQTSVEFRIDMPYTIPSDNREIVVDMTTYEVPASFEYYCVPKINEDAFLMAYMTDWEKYNLLEGEASIFFEGTYIGKSILDVRYVTDTLQVSLGRDKGVSVKREKVKDLTTQKFIGSKKEESRAWRFTVKNNKSEEIQLILLDQVPVPTLDEIEINVKDISRGKWNKETGEIKWTLDLEPSESKEVLLNFAVKYPKHRSLIIE